MTITKSNRVLNRTTLQRQFLLQRVARPADDVVGHLVAMQAQEVGAPYVGLWTRIVDFHADELTALLHDRTLVRGSLLRGTQHLSTAEDYRLLRPLLQPVLDRGRQAALGRMTVGLDLAELATAARSMLTGTTLTRPELGRRLAERFPGYDVFPLAWSAQLVLPVVHPPAKGVATPFVLAQEWLGTDLAAGEPEWMIERYLAAFGPASAMDVQTWSGLTRLREVFDRMRPRLRVYRSEAGKELFDLPNAELADPDLPAPVRLLPEFDNVLIAQADRSRVMSATDQRRVISGALVRPTFLVDGMVHGTWSRRKEVLTLRPFRPLADADRAALVAEAERLLAFVAPETPGSVTVEPPA